MKQVLSAIALAAALAAPAHAAINNVGFESGTANWNPTGDLTAQTSYDANYLNFNGVGYDEVKTTISPVAGAYFGLWAPDNSGFANQPGVFTWTADKVNWASSGDSTGFVYLRLVSSDYWWAPAINDGVKLEFLNGSGTAIGSATIDGNNATGPDSSWQQFSVVAGTEMIRLTLTDQYDIGNNSPLVAIDFSTTAVPEPSSIAMMLAGMGALALKGRRRQKSAQ